MARGFCVIAVVLLHVGLFHVFPLSPDDHGRPLARIWVVLNTAILADLRMPLLLLLSGYLARTKIRQGLSAARTRLAILTNAHIYLVWTLVFFALGVLHYPAVVTTPLRSWRELGWSLLYPQVGPLWFVYVLVISIAVLAATRRLPAPVVLLGFVAVGWAIIAAGGGEAGLPRAVFFAVGALFGEQLIALTTSWLASLLALAGYGILVVLAERVSPVIAYPLDLVGGVCAAVAFLALAQVVARWRVLRVPGAWIGRRTLGVYVLHWPLVAALTWVGLRYPDVLRPLLSHQVVEVAYPILITAVVIALCLLLDRALRAVGLGVLFEPPAPLRRWVTGTSRLHQLPTPAQADAQRSTSG